MVSNFGLCGPTYQTRDGLSNQERSINWYPAIDESADAKSKVSLQPCPGLAEFCQLDEHPVRGLWTGDSRLFACVGGHLYEISSAGAVTSLGFVLNAQTPVQIAASGTTLLVASGDQIWRAADDGAGMLTTKVYDGAISCVFLDGYYIILLSGSADSDGYANYIQLSAGPGGFDDDTGHHPDDDGITWPELEKVKPSRQLDRLWQLQVHEGHLWIFGSHSIQIWYNSGDPDFPFEPIQGTSVDVGTDYPWSIAQIDKHLYFLGYEQRGQARVYRTEGYTPARVSNQAVEFLIDAYLSLGVDQTITGYGYTEDGHTFYVLSFPNAKATIVYDITTNMWHERLRWSGTEWIQWRGSSFHSFVFGRHFVARTTEPPFPDSDHKKIYEQNIRFAADDGLAIRRQRISPYVSKDQQWLMHHYLRLYTDITGHTATRYLTEDGTTWSNTRTVAPYKTAVKCRRLGRARDRLYDVSISSSTERPMIVDGYLHATPGAPER